MHTTSSGSDFPGMRTARWWSQILLTVLLAVVTIGGSIVYANETDRIDRIETRADEIPGMQRDIGAINVKLDFLIEGEKRRQRQDDWERIK